MPLFRQGDGRVVGSVIRIEQQFALALNDELAVVAGQRDHHRSQVLHRIVHHGKGPFEALIGLLAHAGEQGLGRRNRTRFGPGSPGVGRDPNPTVGDLAMGEHVVDGDGKPRLRQAEPEHGPISLVTTGQTRHEPHRKDPARVPLAMVR